MTGHTTAETGLEQAAAERHNAFTTESRFKRTKHERELLCANTHLHTGTHVHTQARAHMHTHTLLSRQELCY